VTAGPADRHAAADHHTAAGHDAAAGRGCLRASHADREHVIDVLKAAFVQGRLTRDDLEARAGRTFTARTHADLAALTADLPAGLAVARAARRPARASARPPVTKAVLACAGAATAPALTLIAIATDSESLARWMFLVAVVYIVAWLAAGAQMLDTWYRRRSRGQLPPRRVPRGRALDGGQDGPAGGDLTACAARADRPARRTPARAWSHPARAPVTAGTPGPAPAPGPAGHDVTSASRRRYFCSRTRRLAAS
jgi:hypothetical protein